MKMIRVYLESKKQNNLFTFQVPHKLAKYKLVEALTFEGKRLVDTIGKVKDALERCKKAGLDLSDDDVYAGETRLGFLNAKNGNISFTSTYKTELIVLMSSMKILIQSR